MSISKRLWYFLLVLFTLTYAFAVAVDTVSAFQANGQFWLICVLRAASLCSIVGVFMCLFEKAYGLKLLSSRSRIMVIGFLLGYESVDLISGFISRA